MTTFRAPYETAPGMRTSSGSTWTEQGVNFCVFSRDARAMELLLYATARDLTPFQRIQLDPTLNRTFFFWHIFVVGLPAGVHYTWRIDEGKELTDPWARAVTDCLWDRAKAVSGKQASQITFRAIVPKPLEPANKPSPLPRSLEGAVIYEMHVGGFTRHPTSGVRHPGTFAGVLEKIPYLKSLGITHVELMPIMAFDEQDIPMSGSALGLSNYWGYSTHSFNSPHPGYCIDPESGNHRQEFREMVDALHDAGIGVILDVVYNHTSEGGEQGPVVNFKAFSPDIAYLRDPEDKRKYRDFTGCGNTVNCNHPLVTRFIVRSMERWVEELSVDGFRCDLASVFARGEDGSVMQNPPLPWMIEFSSKLEGVPLIAEAWDASGLYNVGAFPGMAWAEWNGRYRDVVRKFIRGDIGLSSEMATRIGGSSDLYGDDGRLPCNSVNFVTCHDGFTLRDLVSYNYKHNEANGESNRDGTDDNSSWNCGVEGETHDPQINSLRHQQARNVIAILMLSRGVPMLLAGDEVLRTQRGNNNAYCQDNEISWFDWRLVESEKTMLQFVQRMIAFRKRHPSLTRNRFFTGQPVIGRGIPDVEWHSERLHEPPWLNQRNGALAFTIAGLTPEEPDIHAILNMTTQRMMAQLPEIARRTWTKVANTAEVPGFFDQPVPLPGGANAVPVPARSVVILEAY